MGPYLGDYAEDSIIYFTWDTNDGNGASVAPTVAGTISVFKDDNLAQSVAGITDTRAFDGFVGLHNVKIDLAADAFYAVGHDYHVVLTACTIDGQVVNATLAEFSIQNRSTLSVATIADSVWNELTTGHDIVNTFGQRLNAIRANLAVLGANNAITLDAGASGIDDFYNGSSIFISKGTGIGQVRLITDYDQATKVALVEPDWVTPPAVNSEFVIFPTATTNSSLTSVNTITDAILDADLALHLGAGVGFRNIGNLLGQLAQSEFELRTNVFAIIPVAAQGIDASMVARGCIQYQQVDMSYTKNWAAPDRTYYLLYHYDAQRRNDVVKASLGIVW
jgi:hypothetical protein